MTFKKTQPMSVFFFFLVSFAFQLTEASEENINKALSTISTETALPTQGFECSGERSVNLSLQSPV